MAAQSYINNEGKYHIDKNDIGEEFLEQLRRHLSKPETKKEETPKKPQISIIFLRLNELWKDLLGSGSLKIEYSNNGGTEIFYLTDEKSVYPLEIRYEHQKRITLNYNGLIEQVGKETMVDFVPSIDMTHKVFQELKIDALETELERRMNK